MTETQAKQLADTSWWLGMPDHDIVQFQLFEPRLCMPFAVFHDALERALGRPVWTHELAWADELRKEFLGGKPAPTMADILNLIPAEKRIIIGL